MSSSAKYTIDIDASSAIEGLTKQAMGMDSYLNSLLVKTANATKDEMKSKAPVGVSSSGGIKDSIEIDYNVFAGTGVHKATIGPTAEHAIYVETGTRPHMPPSDALEAWCAAKGLQLWAVLISIKRKGTKAHPFVEPTYHVMKPIIERDFNNGISQYLART